MDIYEPEKRSQIMAAVRTRHTAPELVVRRLLHSLGYRFRLHRDDLPGNPDIVLPRHRAAILVHGCFWHHHKRCKKAKLPATNREFWRRKILRNVQRDKANIQDLERLGWRVMVVWECETSRDDLASRLIQFLQEAPSNSDGGR